MKNSRAIGKSLKFRILSPLFGLLGIFILISLGVVMAFAMHFHHQRRQLESALLINRKADEIARLSSRAKEELLQFRITREPRRISEIFSINAERASLLDEALAAASGQHEQTLMLNAFAESLQRVRALQSSVLKSIETGKRDVLISVADEWAALEALSGAQLLDLLRYEANLAASSQAELEDFLWQLISGIFGILTFAILCIWALAIHYQRTIVVPLSLLRSGLRNVAHGEFGSSIPLPRSKDEINQMTSDFNEMTMALRESQADLKAFVSVAAHDLRSPLATIRSFCDLLEEDVRDGNAIEAVANVQRVSRITDRALEMMNQLLKFERVGAAKLEMRRLKLSKIIEEAVDNLNAAISTSGALIECGPLPEVHGDLSQKRALFQNLINNAIKYRAEERRPHIRVEAQTVQDDRGRWHEIKVMDNGRGFSGDVAESLFKPFTRLETSRGTDGFGVGLSTCRRIVSRHQGEISAQGQPGEGSVFTVRLPAAVH